MRCYNAVAQYACLGAYRTKNDTRPELRVRDGNAKDSLEGKSKEWLEM